MTYDTPSIAGHSHTSSSISGVGSTPGTNNVSFSNLDLLNYSFSLGAGSASQLLRKNADNNGYEFTSSLTDITIDCGTF